MNKVEKAWILMQLLAFDGPLLKMKTLDTTCGRVADATKSRHIVDSAIFAQQNRYGMSWRRSHMLRISVENVGHVVNSVPELAKKVVITSLSGSFEGGGPVAAACGSEEDAQHVLDQAVLDFKHEASEKTLTTDENADTVLNRNQESQAKKEKKNRERKATFEKNKRRRQELREIKEQRRMAAEPQNFRAKTRVANAATASAALQRLQSEQFGILVNFFAQSHNLQAQQPMTPLPPQLPSDPLVMDPNLLIIPESNPTTATASNGGSGPSHDAVTDTSSSPRDGNENGESNENIF